MPSQELKELIETTRNEGRTELCFKLKELEEILPELWSLEELHELDLSNNWLGEIPPEIAGLKELRTLRLRNNKLRSLPRELADLKHLEELDVSGNELEEVPEEILNMENLRELNISMNPVTFKTRGHHSRNLEFGAENRWVREFTKKLVLEPDNGELRNRAMELLYREEAQEDRWLQEEWRKARIENSWWRRRLHALIPRGKKRQELILNAWITFFTLIIFLSAVLVSAFVDHITGNTNLFLTFLSGSLTMVLIFALITYILFGSGKPRRPRRDEEEKPPRPAKPRPPPKDSRVEERYLLELREVLEKTATEPAPGESED